MKTRHAILEQSAEVGTSFADHRLPTPFVVALAWLCSEREHWQAKKWDYKHDVDKLREGGVGEGSEWNTQLMTYLGRIEVLGPDTPGGRQAIAKLAATALALFEASINLYGIPPAPGKTSGVIEEWADASL